MNTVVGFMRLLVAWVEVSKFWDLRVINFVACFKW